MAEQPSRLPKLPEQRDFAAVTRRRYGLMITLAVLLVIELEVAVTLTVC